MAYRKRKYRKYSRRPYSSKRRKVSKTVWKASKRAAKSVVNKMVETKRTHVLDLFAGLQSGVDYGQIGYNPFWAVQFGTEQNDLIGNELIIRYFEIRFWMYHTAAANLLNMPYYVRFTLVKTGWRIPLTAVTAPFFNPPAQFWVTGSQSSSQFLAKWNSNAVTVLGSKTFRLGGITGNTMNGTLGKFGKVKFRKFKGKKTMDSSYASPVNPPTSGAFLKESQYYVIVQQWTPVSSGSSNDFGLRWETSLYYKDP